MIHSEKFKYFLTNILKGLIWLIAIVSLIVYLRLTHSEFLESIFYRFSDHAGLILLIYFISELVFGLIPPEFFLFWGTSFPVPLDYIKLTILLSVLSHIAGITGYFIGRYLHSTKYYQLLYKTYLFRYENRLDSFSFFLLIVAALTPVPYSGVCMLTGAFSLSFRKFLMYSLFRYLRFLFTSIIIWEAISIN